MLQVIRKAQKHSYAAVFHMHRRTLLFLAASAWLFIETAALAENSIQIQGSGQSRINIDTANTTSSLIDIYQVGTGLENKIGGASPITQGGINQTIRIGQGATYATDVWTPGAAVSDNLAHISQSGASGNRAEIYQTTSSNTASISQMSSSHTAKITQEGSDTNSATLTQNSSASLLATIIQNGAAASTLVATHAALTTGALTITQGGAGGHEATLVTSSEYNGPGLTIEQTGSANIASVTGMTGGSASITQSGTGGQVTLIDQDGGTLTILQQGTNNRLAITHYGTGASLDQALSVTQSGITVYDPDPPPSGPTYDPSAP
ncbi:Curlin associated repeat-containing protein [Nitrosomonas cryotolerans]|uniref:Curlin associated repeat-containing protein n=2 Tax=Nitrosomonas cryotolerans TaxID=44575 RepID=A0A1N6G418_9PROT|nr:Curlin associated repeat-containing protein [Nitrosomonas cryotolerans]SIO02258.1 Curlin associated repeat-containing protein [Nitrosomonas cryotolerans ATCC 49181]